MRDSRVPDARRALVERFLRGEIPSITRRSDTAGARSAADPDAPVIAVQTHGTKRPFFLLHGSSEGAALFCFTVARALGDDQPFYALEPYTHGQPGLPSIQAIAAAHIRSLRSVQSEGPYQLGGFCNGGLIALEMARQLQQEGQRVCLLVLMDPWPGGRYTPMRYRFICWIIVRVAALRHWDAQRQLAIFRQLHLARPAAEKLVGHARGWLVAAARSSVALVAGPRSRVATLGAGSDATEPACLPVAHHGNTMSLDEYGALFRWTALTYEPERPYDGALTFFWPAAEVGNRRGWQTRIGPGDASYLVAGTRASWRSTNALALAERLRSCLEEASAAAERLPGAAREQMKTGA